MAPALVDHVVPHQMTRRGYPREWIEDLANLVTCCRACNDFGNRFIVADPAPTSPEAFLDLRDRVYIERRARIAAARAREKRDHFDKLLPMRADTHGEGAPDPPSRASDLMRWSSDQLWRALGRYEQECMDAWHAAERDPLVLGLRSPLPRVAAGRLHPARGASPSQVHAAPSHGRRPDRRRARLRARGRGRRAPPADDRHVPHRRRRRSAGSPAISNRDAA